MTLPISVLKFCPKLKKKFVFKYYPEQDGKTDGSETTSNENQKLCYHKIGTSQTEDVLAVEFLDHPKWRM